MGMLGDNVASFCVHCGKPMPWIQEALDKTAELYDLIDELQPHEKQALKTALPDLVVDVPGTPVAAVKTGKILKKVEAHFREAFKQIMYAYISTKTQAFLKPFGF